MPRKSKTIYEYYMITRVTSHIACTAGRRRHLYSDDEGCIAVSISKRLVPSSVSGNHEYLTVLLSHECNWIWPVGYRLRRSPTTMVRFSLFVFPQLVIHSYSLYSPIVDGGDAKIVKTLVGNSHDSEVCWNISSTSPRCYHHHRTTRRYNILFVCVRRSARRSLKTVHAHCPTHTHT